MDNSVRKQIVLKGDCLAPIDRVAARVTAPGFSCASTNIKAKVSEGRVISSVPLPTRQHDRNEVDLTGRRMGKFTVVGKSLLKGRWVVRCQCGNYEHRWTTAITGYDSDVGPNGGSCQDCEHGMRQYRHVAKRAANAVTRLGTLPLIKS